MSSLLKKSLVNRHISRCVKNKFWNPLFDTDCFKYYFTINFSKRLLKEVYFIEKKKDLFYYTIETSCFYFKDSKKFVFCTFAYVSDPLGGFYCAEINDFVYEDFDDTDYRPSLIIDSVSPLLNEFKKEKYFRFHYHNVFSLREKIMKKICFEENIKE